MTIEVFHAPQSRASTIVQLLDELDALDRVALHAVTIARQDGSGGADAANPHPEGKVPCLRHDGVVMTETNGIALYLTDLFPENGVGYAPGEARRGPYLSWLAWYGNVVEPVVHFHLLGLDHPVLTRTFRDWPAACARIEAQLQATPWLAGDRFTAADMLIAPIFQLFPQLVPESGPIPDWVARQADRPAARRQAERDGQPG